MTTVPPTPAESEPTPADSTAVPAAVTTAAANPGAAEPISAAPTAVSDSATDATAETGSGTDGPAAEPGKTAAGVQREPAPAEPPLRRNLVILAAMALTVIAALVAAGMMVG
ncbi:hypothetical protein ABZ319_31870 [Nocardia sp. NPDC005978]|uniref:hypothetical protein n=1 Tax=Nocardia sp. NPDC005978 TaxID=3156725 RepID=UPI0033A8FCAF